jgi:uroporphyrinogen-III synthase
MKNIILITRPEENAAQTAYALNQKGYLTFCEPFLDVVFHDVSLPDLDQVDALVFSSANAVQAFILKSDRRDIMAYCVGDNTLHAVRHAGFENYKSAKGKVSDLIELLQQEPIKGQILYCRARDITQELKIEGKALSEVILYHTEKSKEISQNCLDLLTQGAISTVLFYSLKTAETFIALIEKNGVKEALKQCQALCLGDSMLECITKLQWKHVKVATTPDREGMFQLLETINE